MRFRLKTVEDRYTEDEVEKLRLAGFSFDAYEQPITGNMIYEISTREEDAVFLEIESIEGLMNFQKEWGKLILEGDTITIYDGYAE